MNLHYSQRRKDVTCVKVASFHIRNVIHSRMRVRLLKRDDATVCSAIRSPTENVVTFMTLTTLPSKKDVTLATIASLPHEKDSPELVKTRYLLYKVTCQHG